MWQRVCKKCLKNKSINDFVKRSSTGSGYRHTCKKCHSLNQMVSDKRKSLLKERKQHSKRLTKKYGISIEDYDKLEILQNGRCAICRNDTPGKSKFRFAVDHDHETGVVRGLLCHQCNLGIGLLKDCPKILQCATEYLEVFKRG